MWANTDSYKSVSSDNPFSQYLCRSHDNSRMNQKLWTLVLKLCLLVWGSEVLRFNPRVSFACVVGEQNQGGGSTERLMDLHLRRRHTICNPTMRDEHGATIITFPFEYTNSKQIFDALNGPAVSPILHRRKQQQLPHSVSKSSLQEEFFQSNHWQTAMECLSLNLEEVVHIRYVLTKAELEALPMECSLKEDVEKGKVRNHLYEWDLVIFTRLYALRKYSLGIDLGEPLICNNYCGGAGRIESGYKYKYCKDQDLKMQLHINLSFI